MCKEIAAAAASVVQAACAEASTQRTWHHERPSRRLPHAPRVACPGPAAWHRSLAHKCHEKQRHGQHCCQARAAGRHAAAHCGRPGRPACRLSLHLLPQLCLLLLQQLRLLLLQQRLLLLRLVLVWRRLLLCGRCLGLLCASNSELRRNRLCGLRLHLLAAQGNLIRCAAVSCRSRACSSGSRHGGRRVRCCSGDGRDGCTQILDFELASALQGMVVVEG